MKSNEDTATDVLYEFSLAQEVPDADLLDQFVRRYPNHADALTNLAVRIVLEAADPEEQGEVDPSPSPAVSRAMSRFQNRLYEVKRQATPPAAVPPAQPSALENPFGKLNRIEFRNLAQHLHGNTVFLGMLRDREIDPNTMTPGFKRFVADQMTAPLDLVVAHFGEQRSTQTGQYYKAEGKPQLSPQVSFEDAVRKSGLTQEQQEFLLSL